MEIKINEQILNKTIAMTYNLLQQNFKVQNNSYRNRYAIDSKDWCSTNTILNQISAAIKILEKIQELKDIRFKLAQFCKFGNWLKEIGYQEYKGSEEA